MSESFNITTLVSAIALVSIASTANAAGLDRSGQPSAAFSSSGTTAYISAYHINADTTGEYSDGRKFEGVAQSYEGYGYGVKTDVTDGLSFGVFYDQPFGAEIEIEGENPLVNSTNPNDIKRTQASVKSDTFTGLVGMDFGANNNFKVYAGPVLSKVDGKLELHSGDAPLGPISGYTLGFPKSIEYGYMVGAAYVKPEIALKAAITYRSEIDHDIDFGENMPSVAAYGLNTTQTKTSKITLPKSVNIDFQTGLNKTTLLTAKARWVPWSKFIIAPPLFENNIKTLRAVQGQPVKSAPLLAYTDDSYMVELGLGKRLTPQLAVSGSIGWDKGAGNPVSPLGPVEGYYSVGLGAKYNVTPEWSVALGGKYLILGDADGQLSATKTDMGKFEDNDAYIVGMKLAYAAK